MGINEYMKGIKDSRDNKNFDKDYEMWDRQKQIDYELGRLKFCENGRN